MNTKYTPGPWKQYRDHHGRVRIHGNVQGGPVAFVEETNNSGGTEQDHANARLIAAAPELLEALEASVALHCEHTPEIHVREFLRAARAAIAKATNG